MAKKVEKITKLEQQQKELAEKIKREKAKIRREEREQVKRRKTLAGELVLDNLKEAPEVKAWLEQLLEEKLTDNRDRELFGLKPKPKDEQT